MNPRISVVICTYNGEDLIAACLDSILHQQYPDVEVLVVDGGSSDGTRAIVGRYVRAQPHLRLIDNPRRLPEGRGNGKWLGSTQATGSVLAFIDQDNVLQSAHLFSSAVTQLQDRSILGVLGGATHDRKDSPVVRYVALVGTDSFLAYRSLDFISRLGPVQDEYQEYPITADNMMLTGGNCFFYRMDDLKRIGGYSQDVLVVRSLLDVYPRIGVIPRATKHHAARDMGALIKKKLVWGQAYFLADLEQFNYWPHTRREFFAFSKNIIFNLSLVLNLYYSFRLFVLHRDGVSFLFPLVSFLNTWAYAIHVPRRWLSQKRGKRRFWSPRRDDKSRKD